MSKLLASLMRNYFPKRSSSAPLHTLSKLYDVSLCFVTTPLLRLCTCISSFAVAVARYRMICLVLHRSFSFHACDSISFSNRDTSRNAWNRHWGSFMVDTGILSNNMKFPSHKCLMTFFDLTIYNDNPLLIRLCTELDFLPNLSGFHRTFALGVACRQGTLTPPDTWSCPIWDLQMFFCWDHWHSIIRNTTNSWLLAWSYRIWLLSWISHHHSMSHSLFWLLTELDMTEYMFPFGICNGCGMLTVDAYPSGHLVPSLWDLHILLVETNLFSELVVIFPDYALRISLGTFSILLRIVPLLWRGWWGECNVFLWCISALDK